jgi:hypothetical protein
MASTAIARMKDLQERHGATMARARAKAQAAVKAQQHTVIAAGAAYALGAAEKRGTELPTIEGVDPKLVYGATALLAGFMIKDQKMRAIAQSVGDGLISIVAYNQGRGVSPLSPSGG